MAVSTQSFSSFVANAVAAVQGAASALVDFTVGAVTLAIMQANVQIALWLQAEVLQVGSMTRFATSNGADADSWGADYQYGRLPATTASGAVTFSRITATALATINAGTLVESTDGSQQYVTVNLVTIAPGTTSATANVVALVAGSAGNAAAGIINTLGQSIPGVDSVTNASPFTNGKDAETDAAFKARFPLYIAGLPKATLSAVESAIASVQQGLYYSVTENQDYNGTADNGFFYVVVDDGSGSPSGTLLSNVSNAVDAARAIGSRFGVFAPIVISATVALTITVATGYTKSIIAPIVQTAITAYINSLTLGESLSYLRLAQVAFDASPGITDVTAMTLNAGTSDVAATNQEVIRTATVTIS